MNAAIPMKDNLPVLPMEFRVHRWRMVLLLIITVLLIAGCMDLFLHPPGEQAAQYVVRFVTGAAILIAAYLTLWGIGGLLHPRLVCRFTAQGIDKGSHGKYVIPWKDIDSARVVTFRRRPYVGIALKDNEAFYSRNNGRDQKIMKMGMRLVGVPVAVNIAIAGIDAQTMCDWINGFCKQYRD